MGIDGLLPSQPLLVHTPKYKLPKLPKGDEEPRSKSACSFYPNNEWDTSRLSYMRFVERKTRNEAQSPDKKRRHRNLLPRLPYRGAASAMSFHRENLHIIVDNPNHKKSPSSKKWGSHSAGTVLSPFAEKTNQSTQLSPPHRKRFIDEEYSSTTMLPLRNNIASKNLNNTIATTAKLAVTIETNGEEIILVDDIESETNNVSATSSPRSIEEAVTVNNHITPSRISAPITIDHKRKTPLVQNLFIPQATKAPVLEIKVIEDEISIETLPETFTSSATQHSIDQVRDVNMNDLDFDQQKPDIWSPDTDLLPSRSRKNSYMQPVRRNSQADKLKLIDEPIDWEKLIQKSILSEEKKTPSRRGSVVQPSVVAKNGVPIQHLSRSNTGTNELVTIKNTNVPVPSAVISRTEPSLHHTKVTQDAQTMPIYFEDRTKPKESIKIPSSKSIIQLETLKNSTTASRVNLHITSMIMPTKVIEKESIPERLIERVSDLTPMILSPSEESVIDIEPETTTKKKKRKEEPEEKDEEEMDDPFLVEKEQNKMIMTTLAETGLSEVFAEHYSAKKPKKKDTFDLGKYHDMYGDRMNWRFDPGSSNKKKKREKKGMFNGNRQL
jgi:hypothetical protein